MERIVREILNFNPMEASDFERGRLCADITGLALSMLDDKGIYDIPRDAEIKYADIDGGSFGTLGLRLEREIFTKQYNFLRDLMVIPHEICHLAQDCYKDKSKIVKANQRVIYNTKFFLPLLYNILSENMGYNDDEILYLAFNDYPIREDNGELLHKYFKSFYLLQSFELDANEFAKEFVNKILIFAKTLDLNEDEQITLEYLEHCYNDQLLYREEKYEEIRNIRANPVVQHLVKTYTNEALNTFFQKKPDFLNELKVMSEEEYQELLNNELSPIHFLLNCLQINYDDELAHKLFSTLYESNLTETRAMYIVKLLSYTQLNLTENERTQFDEVLEQSNSYNNLGLTYEGIMRERSRIANESAKLENPNCM